MYCDWDVEAWRSVLFSNEAKSSIGTDEALHVWRCKGEEYLLQCCDLTVKHSPSVMVWGSMSYYGVRSLVRLEGRVDALTYQGVLEDHMLFDTQWLIGEEVVFQQDNVPIHTARSTWQWLRVLDWPLQSSDANPIEILWHTLEVSTNRRHPQNEEEAWRFVQKVWQTIPAAHVQILY